MDLTKGQELELKKIVKSYFGDSWNYHHTILAVSWMKKLIKAEGGNPLILVTAMYLHDIGYSKYLNSDNYTLADRIKAKKKHMIAGAMMAKSILKKLNFSNANIEKIAHLIKIHDKIFEIKTKNEKMVMEADSLAGIDHRKLPASFNKKDMKVYIKFFMSTRAKLFKTNTGKKYLAVLLKYVKI
ncbi:MAG: HD domain-containing protein [Candidatus Buchananbacteria bacterium]